MIIDGLYDLWTSWGLLGVLVATGCCLLAVWIMRRPPNLPPGPWGWPLLGVTFSGKAEPLVVTDWIRKYGDIMSYYRGPHPVVSLGSYALIREAYVRNAENFSSRPRPLNPVVATFKTKGVVQEPYGPTWKEHRKFTLMSLRDFGVGKRSLEGKILEEARALVEEISKKETQLEGFCISNMMQVTVSNVICSIVFGSRYEYDDPKFIGLIEAIDKFFSIPVSALLPAFIPILRYIPVVNRSFVEGLKVTLHIGTHIQEQIREHEATFDPNDIRDFIDAFLLEKRGRQADENTTFTEQQNIMVVMDLFLAGTETTSTTLRWALLYMILHPDVQETVQREIDSVIGPDRDPSMAHRAQMPYTEATLTEVSRLASIAPFSVPHTTSNDVTFRGYNIPKGTIVQANLWAVHHDPRLWPDPHKFDPARFLDAAGKFVKREEVMPFSIGRRVCLGEQLARMELFLFFTSLLQRFSFKLPEGSSEPSEEGVFGATHSPVPFKLVATPRN
ncbi:PREDICTED: cytochrome P450 2U1-like [Branchiostoma belcheri]|uniref:Cytochrome P450 2U1 n=1 Tax=Branchiostoma belcheri TaxID=7741 RepID=A0A6P4YTX5_BRABE|nr:PREDICTED: cytochrome P450 2U1-like [Branchiostoma belcheri]